MRTTDRILGANAVATGFLLGVLQWGVFFTLTSYLASTAMIYLLATVVWLIGSVLGLRIGGPDREPVWLALAMTAYFALRLLAGRYLYQLEALPGLLLPVVVMGAYAGRFFRARAARFSRTKWLFFLENNGFVLGTVLTSVALCWSGEGILNVLPVLGAAAALGTGALLPPRPDRFGAHPS